jgi:peroxiredoxin
MRSAPSARAVLAIAGLAVFSAWITWRAKATEIRLRSHNSAVILSGRPAPDFTLSTLDGRRVSLADYRGRKKVVVSFWASWCGPCRMEAPSLRSLYTFADKSDSEFEVLAVNLSEDLETAAKGATDLKMPFPVLLDSEGSAAEAYSVDAIPSTFVVDKNGMVTFGHTGFDLTLEVMLATQLGIKNYTPQPGVPDVNRH